MVPRKQAGHMTCTRPQAERQILLAMRASSTHDPGCVKTPLLCYDSLVILRENLMRRFVEQADRGQWTLLPNASTISLMRATLFA